MQINPFKGLKTIAFSGCQVMKFMHRRVKFTTTTKLCKEHPKRNQFEKGLCFSRPSPATAVNGSVRSDKRAQIQRGVFPPSLVLQHKICKLLQTVTEDSLTKNWYLTGN